MCQPISEAIKQHLENEEEEAPARVFSQVLRLSDGINVHFRCWVWQAQILDVIHRVLLLQHHSDLYEASRHKVATYDIFSI